MGFLKRIKEKKLFRKETFESAESVRFQMLEPLEPRLLLSADMSLSALAGQSLDLTLRLESDRQEIQIVDNASQLVLQSQVFAETRSVVITGADKDDKLTIDSSTPF
ncbi:MAG: LEPR-XLL domain-containing protein, partial [Planctomycetota bacterium]